MVECTFVEVTKTMKRAHLASLCLISVLPRAGAQSYKCFKNDPSQAGKMDLFVSTFITEKRGAENNRYPRIDIFNYTLQTYSRMPIDRAFFFLTIDDEHTASIPRPFDFFARNSIFEIQSLRSVLDIEIENKIIARYK